MRLNNNLLRKHEMKNSWVAVNTGKVWECAVGTGVDVVMEVLL